MTRSRFALAALVAIALTSSLRAADEAMKPAPAAARTIDLAICLDVSGSMRGLVDSARSKLWAIVNDLALAKPAPRLRVALLTFGHDTYPVADGWVRVDSDLTEDLDLISQKLFALTLKGGTELVGRVMNTGLDKLSWSKDANSLKIMIVAGNESADQDRVCDYRKVSKRAIESGIIVNTIYCGNAADTIAPGWKDVALRADGRFASIDQNRGTVAIATPFDKPLAELSTALNATYVPFGREGKKNKARQSVQDANASNMGGGAAASRAKSKSSRFYRADWCLVDAVRAKKVDVEKLKKEELPEELREKSGAEILKILDAKFAERAKIQKQVNELHKKRAAFVAAEMKKKKLDGDKAFDAAIRKSIRSQAARKGYAFEEETK
ncbi:MAG: vWA domain-containing protein [Planctomycetota bacterium]|jgi:hypothetical protein